MLEVQFSLLFSNKAYFRVCFVVHKVQLPFFSCRSLLLGTSVPNDKLNTFMNKSTKIVHFYNHVIVVLQFVLLMDPLSLKV